MTMPQSVSVVPTKQPNYCSFCGKEQKEVRSLIAGPTVFICNECVSLCVKILQEKGIEVYDASERFRAIEARVSALEGRQ